VWSDIHGPFDKKNYRPVSILPTISKIYEMVLSDQLVEFFNNIFQDFLCAFRKGTTDHPLKFDLLLTNNFLVILLIGMTVHKQPIY
jgi:hypothetical protein